MDIWDKIISDLDTSTQNNVNEFVKSLDGVSKSFYEEVLVQLGQLKLKTGTITPSSKEMADNLKKLLKIQAQMNSLLMSSGYKEHVSSFLSTYDLTKTAIREYYEIIVPGFKESSDLYKAIKQVNVSTTADSLLGAGVDANFLDPVKKALTNMVSKNSPVSVVKKELRDLIIGNDTIEPRLKSYSSQVANDSIKQFQRNYINAIADDLGLKFYFYKGTEISDTREFCHVRHGHYYTEKEVKGWASLNWKGKAKGTNESTIFTYVGGYNCRHTILPISETIYKAKVNER